MSYVPPHMRGAGGSARSVDTPDFGGGGGGGRGGGFQRGGGGECSPSVLFTPRLTSLSNRILHSTLPISILLGARANRGLRCRQLNRATRTIVMPSLLC
jgi:hypothetical protein